MNYKIISQCLDLAEDSIIITAAEPLDLPGPKIIYVNKAFSKMTGFSYEEAIGKTPRILQSKETSRRKLDQIKSALTKGEYIRIELVNSRKDGVAFWMELSISPIYNGKKSPKYFISVQKLIDERIEKEMLLEKTVKELEDKVDSLNQINIATVHDLKEPIRSIHSFTQLLERSLKDVTLDESSAKYFSFLKNSAKRLESTINTLHKYSSIKKDKNPINIKLNNIISEACENLNKKIGESNASIEIQGNEALFGNKSDLTRLFQNLIDNSIKHCNPKIPPLINIQITKDNKYIQVLIKDNGKGIPLDFHSNIFQLFSKYNTETNDKSLGAGLALCKKIVNNNNGSIELLETSQNGTTFIILFEIANQLSSA